MSSIMGNIVNALKRMGYFALQYFFTSYHWSLKLIKTQFQQMRKSRVLRDMEKAYGVLGAEMYSLYKQGVTSDLKQIPVVEQQLKYIEEVESRIFQVDENINEIQNYFSIKKEEIEKNYAQKRAAVGICTPEDEQGEPLA